MGILIIIALLNYVIGILIVIVYAISKYNFQNGYYRGIINGLQDDIRWMMRVNRPHIIYFIGEWLFTFSLLPSILMLIFLHLNCQYFRSFCHYFYIICKKIINTLFEKWNNIIKLIYKYIMRRPTQVMKYPILKWNGNIFNTYDNSLTTGRISEIITDKQNNITEWTDYVKNDIVDIVALEKKFTIVTCGNFSIFVKGLGNWFCNWFYNELFCLFTGHIVVSIEYINLTTLEKYTIYKYVFLKVPNSIGSDGLFGTLFTGECINDRRINKEVEHEILNCTNVIKDVAKIIIDYAI